MYLLVFVPLTAQFQLTLLISDTSSELYYRTSSLLLFAPGAVFLCCIWTVIHLQVFVHPGKQFLHLIDLPSAASEANASQLASASSIMPYQLQRPLNTWRQVLSA